MRCWIQRSVGIFQKSGPKSRPRSKCTYEKYVRCFATRFNYMFGFSPAGSWLFCIGRGFPCGSDICYGVSLIWFDWLGFPLGVANFITVEIHRPVRVPVHLLPHYGTPIWNSIKLLEIILSLEGDKDFFEKNKNKRAWFFKKR